MNSLSWLIYWANVLGSVNTFLGIIFVVGIVGGGICFLLYLARSTDYDDEFTLSLKPMAKKLAVGATVAALISIPIPSAETVYAIAASESGEKIATSETGKKAIKALDAWLDKQIKSDAK